MSWTRRARKRKKEWLAALEERRRGRFLPRQASPLLLLRPLRKRINRGLLQRRGGLPPPTHLLALIHRNAWKEVFYELRANGVLWEVSPGYVARMMATGSIFWHHVYEALRLHGKRKGIKVLRAARVGPPQGAQEAIVGRVAPGFGWFGLGVLAAGATAWALFSRQGRSPSNGQDADGQEPDGQEPDVVLDVPELEVDRITLEVRDLRAHVSILAELANLVNISVGVDA